MLDPSSSSIRTAVRGDLPELQRVFRAASLSNEDDAPLLLARPEFLAFTGDGIVDGRTRVAVSGVRITGFATVTNGDDGELELEDLFVDPVFQRRGIARRLVLDAARAAGEGGRVHLLVLANPHALGFYESVGFKTVGTAATELGHGHRMRLEVGPTPPGHR